MSESAQAAAPPRRQGLVVLYTGQGKGKTTAALGMVFRALGRKMRVAVVQFIKGKWMTGERMFADAQEGLVFEVTGRGFTWDSDDLSRDALACREGWERAARLIASGDYDIVVLDELTYALNYGFVATSDVLAALRGRPAAVHVVITGRNAAPELIEAADLVTEMRSLKHPYERGIPAQQGVDY